MRGRDEAGPHHETRGGRPMIARMLSAPCRRTLILLGWVALSLAPGLRGDGPQARGQPGPRPRDHRSRAGPRARQGDDAPLRRRAARRARHRDQARPRRLEPEHGHRPAGRRDRPRLPRRRLRGRPDPGGGRAQDRPAGHDGGAPAEREDQPALPGLGAADQQPEQVLLRDGHGQHPGPVPDQGQRDGARRDPPGGARSPTACPRRPTWSGPIPSAGTTRS